MPAEPAALPWRDLDAGPVLPGETSRRFLTGDWRERRPRLDLDRCVHCLLCWLYCPDTSVLVAGGRVVGIDLDYCKGCGVCAAVCPPSAAAITMVEEER
ncbi:MAG: 4Fe-4S dicluster-binding protein [Armatimonadota bacterium]|nr:4Fe-4S dicluster-binding protein [Armatimonadota bacterium]MDR7449697.1 4Fe-4S dicluster-binding protein [Armatimonadota bacterium]MDR7458387.1 4Fe-4S dicluster-binding protein [Armatimonadota bacterium]MDR7478810.1 4Fe-4S dicluster-binding protein [Armatimonadota bacterium]MDR7488833.1 4Fe-4S dicluster-binding protein [Armatimonadota bacterium]